MGKSKVKHGLWQTTLLNKGMWMTMALVGSLSVASLNVQAAYNVSIAKQNLHHQTPKFDYLHLEREAVSEAPQGPRTHYQRFREGVTLYFQEAYTDALSVLRPLADENHASAQFYIALMYDQGHGVLKNHEVAASWYQRASALGHIDAQYNLGIAFASGQGVPFNIQQAIHWWQQAATYGSVDAQYNLGMVYTTGRGVERNAELAVKWWKKAAFNGDAAAQFNLGVVYVNGGKGVPQNVCEASRLWRISAEQGFERAKTALRMLKTIDRKDTKQGCWSLTAQN